MARHSGRQGKVLLNAIGTQPASAASLNNWKLSYAPAFLDVTAFMDTNKAVIPDLASITGSFAGFWDDAEDKPFSSAKAAAGGFIYCYPDATNSATKYAYGPAYFTMNIDVPVSGAVTIDGTFQAAGDWWVNL